MRKAGTWCKAVLMLLSICGAACSRSDKPKELVALDKAYDAGILNRDEYQARKAALESVRPTLLALDKAFEAGVLTKEDSDARKAALVSKARTLAALDRAFKAGILSGDEYAGKKAALLAAAAPGPPSTVAQGSATAAVVNTALQPSAVTESANRALAASPAPGSAARPQEGRLAASVPNAPASANQFAGTQPNARQSDSNQAHPNPPSRDGQKSVVAGGTATSAASAGDGHLLRLKVFSIIDAHGYERPLVSATVLLPVDWQAQGETNWVLKDSCNTVQTSLHASGPDGRGVDLWPSYSWNWADNPQPLQIAAAQKAQAGGHACDVMPPMSASDFLRRNLAKIRPNAQLVGIEPASKVMQILQQQARQNQQSAAQYGLRQQIRPDAVRGRLKYNLNGKPVEEWIYVTTIITGTLGPSFNAQMQPTQAYTYSCVATIVAERTLQGQLDSSEKFFELINSTYRTNAQWQARVSGTASNVQQAELKGVRERSAIVSKTADDISNIRRQQFENQQRSEDHVFQQFSENTRGVDTYRNPASGETIELSNQYGHAWVNDRGEYLLSDQEGFDPSVTFKENWTQLQHVKP